jgi:hypothetical protein
MAAPVLETYQCHFLFIPYVLGDLLLTSTVELFGPTLAGTLWTAAAYLALPVAVLIYLRTTGFVANRSALLFVVSPYLATDRPTRSPDSQRRDPPHPPARTLGHEGQIIYS